MEDYIKYLYNQEIEGLKNIIDQYRKELIWAENGTHLCAGLPLSERRAIAQALRESIQNNERVIKQYELQIS